MGITQWAISRLWRRCPRPNRFFLRFSKLSWEYTARISVYSGLYWWGINLLYVLHFLYDFITRASFISSQQEASCAGFAWLKIFHGHRVSFFHARSGNRITFAAIFTHFTVKMITPVTNCCFVKNILIHWFSTISASAKQKARRQNGDFRH